jgi:polyhydroxyalkanoate synthesis regulator phasin
MPENDLLKRLLDAGMTLTAVTQARAEEVIRDLVQAGAVQRDQAQSNIDELIERSRRNRERWLETARAELDQRLEQLDLATRGDLEHMVQRVAETVVAAVRQVMPERGDEQAPPARPSPGPGTAAGTSAASKTAAKKTAARKTAASKTAAKKTSAKKTSAKKTSAKKTSAKKTSAKTASAKKSPARTTSAKTTPAKKSPAKKSPAGKTAAKSTAARKTTAAKKRSG